MAQLHERYDDDDDDDGDDDDDDDDDDDILSTEPEVLKKNYTNMPLYNNH